MGKIIGIDFVNRQVTEVTDNTEEAVKSPTELMDLASKSIVWYEEVKTHNPYDVEGQSSVWSVADSYLAQLTPEQQHETYRQAEMLIEQLKEMNNG